MRWPTAERVVVLGHDRARWFAGQLAEQGHNVRFLGLGAPSVAPMVFGPQLEQQSYWGQLTSARAPVLFDGERLHEDLALGRRKLRRALQTPRNAKAAFRQRLRGDGWRRAGRFASLRFGIDAERMLASTVHFLTYHEGPWVPAGPEAVVDQILAGNGECLDDVEVLDLEWERGQLVSVETEFGHELLEEGLWTDCALAELTQFDPRPVLGHDKVVVELECNAEGWPPWVFNCDPARWFWEMRVVTANRIQLTFTVPPAHRGSKASDAEWLEAAAQRAPEAVQARPEGSVRRFRAAVDIPDAHGGVGRTMAAARLREGGVHMIPQPRVDRLRGARLGMG